ncbi:MAG: bifunctional (p)ppGpp synthetase/guanosine-3',5'-bis(diphosphate) 3'-pyrophosphohydrolase (plasmid) [Candidatus Megaira endosymbiont of Mesostigma viride]|nr:MAG: bifunctional (p)ppGpp synthetase/guanosine-3',5'-bis(diphosphate) 3'-pyrophosphohydrolase [Candidatus Megaira endosymbiont of Mesostigma viride]HJK89025.1 bifunctional (p)ppGpp synthetase/guanosine-3',5'-bis(diphosphate) 3'-pyrophosphohydrolase [Candidatus Megaira endosymbiont of Mesostigma viride]
MDNKPKDCSYNQEINLICNQLQALGITTDISCRVKDPYSILHKLTRKSVKIEELTDIVGFRIIVNEQDECYTALKLIQEIYKVIPEKYRDYINKPKTNGYRSLHTVILLGSYGLPVEIQIHTRGMHNIAENGKAAHSRYKQNQEQQTVTPRKLNLLTKAYEILDQDDLTESSLFAYLQKVTNYLERSFVELQNKTNSDNCYESP